MFGTINKRLLKFFENYFVEKYRDHLQLSKHTQGRTQQHNDQYNYIRRNNSFEERNRRTRVR